MIVYVITPSLNKSFKFQSDWPNNNSQSYLLTSVAKDLKDDSAYKFTQKDKDYVFTTKTNYPNNPKYVKQNIITAIYAVRFEKNLLAKNHTFHNIHIFNIRLIK